MSQNHFTVGFALKSSADAKSLTEQLASTDAGAVPGGGCDRHDPLLALHGV